ncbi:MAG: hypothetical protein CMP49_01675 [Flavobacteriales bacterium]|nr:hypothetical protein [Flavobacteriales bacterium]
MNKKLNIVLFCYNFPHRKTIDFFNKLYQNQFNISLILAANYIQIESPKSAISLPKKHIQSSIDELAKKHSIPFFVVKHNSQDTIQLVKEYKINFGVISGARILNKKVINLIRYGVINFHPGILPYIRGLDSILWAIYKKYPIGVTAHLINDKIDSGLLVCQQKINISFDDNIESLYEKNYQLQLDLLPISLNLVLQNKIFKDLELGEYNSKMTYEMQLMVKKSINQYIKNNLIE